MTEVFDLKRIDHETAAAIATVEECRRLEFEIGTALVGIRDQLVMHGDADREWYRRAVHAHHCLKRSRRLVAGRRDELHRDGLLRDALLGLLEAVESGGPCDTACDAARAALLNS